MTVFVRNVLFTIFKAEEIDPTCNVMAHVDAREGK